MRRFARRALSLGAVMTLVEASTAGASPSGVRKSPASSPWVFDVSASGKVAARFDNVATELDLQNAIGREIQ